MKRETLPCAPDVERLVLGSVMLDGSAMDGLRGAVEPQFFSLETHRRIWDGMCAIYDTGVPVDRVTLLTHMRNRGEASAQSFEYLLDLDEGVPDLPAIDQYVEILREKFRLRRIFEITSSISTRCTSGAETSSELSDALAAAISEANTSGSDRKPVSTRDLIAEFGMDALLSSRRTEGLRLPWSQLNDALCGMNPGQMIVLAGGTGSGKSSMALQIAAHATKQGKHPVIWTMEMSPRQMFNRMVTQISAVDGDRGRNGALTPDQVSRRKEAAGWLHAHPVWFDRHSRTVPSFCASVRQSMNKSDVGLGVVDYLQLIRGVGRPESRTREVAENSRNLKLAAMDLGIPLLVLSQFHRLGDKKAGIHALKESGDIENDADVILILDLPDKEKAGSATELSGAVFVGKQREGPDCFDVPVIFNRPTQAFYSTEDR